MLCLLGSRDPELRGLGVDVSEGAVQMAKDMARKIAGPSGKPELDFQVLDAAGELPPGTYDVVILADVLHHIPVQSQRDAVLKAARLVRPGGIFLYKDMCRKPAWRALMNRLHDLVVAQQWIHYVAVQQVENWVRDAGLTLTTAQDLTRFWYGHELRVFVKSSPAAS
jgi:2-polyprenyl-3-methyl-5-hydroxy-6-metoxy-1,4-benzoquinol methylase